MVLLIINRDICIFVDMCLPSVRWLYECKRCRGKKVGWCCPVLWLSQTISLLQTKRFSTDDILVIRDVYIKIFYMGVFVQYFSYTLLAMYFKGTESRILLLLKNTNTLLKESKTLLYWLS